MGGNGGKCDKKDNKESLKRQKYRKTLSKHEKKEIFLGKREKNQHKFQAQGNNPLLGRIYSPGLEVPGPVPPEGGAEAEVCRPDEEQQEQGKDKAHSISIVFFMCYFILQIFW